MRPFGLHEATAAGSGRKKKIAILEAGVQSSNATLPALDSAHTATTQPHSSSRCTYSAAASQLLCQLAFPPGARPRVVKLRAEPPCPEGGREGGRDAGGLESYFSYKPGGENGQFESKLDQSLLRGIRSCNHVIS